MIERRSFLLASAAALLLPAAAFGRQKRSVATVIGARGPIEIVEDALGIPHVRANTLHDAFFGQGYLVARDRLFQIDLSRRRQLGRMAEAFGPRFVEADRSARLFLYHGDVDAELRSIPADVLDCAHGYVAGINARIAEVEADPALLPLEYGILGIAPERWDVQDLVRIRSSSRGDAADEVRRARLQALGMLEADALMAPLRPEWSFTIPAGLDCAAVSEADLGVLLDSGKPLPFDEIELAQFDPEDARFDWAAQGSNAWTVAPGRTATGRPILANDPHLGIGGFSPRHIAHLSAPGLDVIGAGAPGLPGIMQGHTDRFAFGRTNFHIDQTDLFILRTDPADPERYWHAGEWKRFTIVEQEIPVRGGPAERITLRYAGWRPVLSRDPARQRAVAFASVSLMPGANAQFAMIAINLARDWESLRRAFRLHVSPTNFHYADIDGNTGWHAIGFVPRRPRHDGLFPAPGDGDFDWTGIVPVEEMPNIYNPPEGWFASANQMNIPADYDYRRTVISFDWTDPFRYRRVSEVLSGQPRHSVDDSIRLQHDVQSLPARALIAMLPAQPRAEAAPAAALLRGWDCAVEADSAAALLYAMLMPELSAGFRDMIVPAAAKALVPSVNLDEMLRILAAGDERLGPDPARARDALVERALVAGWKRAVEVAGPDPAQWRWGDIHRVRIAHPLSMMPGIAAAFPAIEGGRSGGDGTTPMARGFNARRGFDVSHGASYLFVADVGQWDNSRFLLLPGQSGDPRSPRYADFYPPWLAGRMQPMWFSRKAVDRNAAGRTLLTPAPDPRS